MSGTPASNMLSLYCQRVCCPCCARSGSCLSSVLNANVRGVYGTTGVARAVATDFISHWRLRSEWSEVGESLETWSSSYSILEAARWAAVGMSE